MRVIVSAKGQIVIPAKLRRKYNIEQGTKLEARENKGKIELEPLPSFPLLALRGRYKGKTSLTQTLLEERRRDRERENA